MGFAESKDKVPSLWWELGPSQRWASTFMILLSQLFCGRNDVSDRITDLSVSISAFKYNLLFRNQSHRKC